jgi:phage virion morphogenesis protein
MAGASIQIEDNEIRRGLQRLISKLQDLRPAYKAIGEQGLVFIDEYFEKEQDPGGTPWADLQPATLKRKQGQGSTLVGVTRPREGGSVSATGDLRRIAYQVRSGSVEWGSNRIYAATHQFGDESRSIPPRPFLGFNDLALQEFGQILLDHLEPD